MTRKRKTEQRKKRKLQDLDSKRKLKNKEMEQEKGGIQNLSKLNNGTRSKMEGHDDDGVPF